MRQESTYALAGCWPILRKPDAISIKYRVVAENVKGRNFYMPPAASDMQVRTGYPTLGLEVIGGVEHQFPVVCYD